MRYITLKEETFAGRNFHVFADFGLFRESFSREIFRDLSTVKIYSRKTFKISQSQKFMLANFVKAKQINPIIKGCQSLNSFSLENL